MKALVVGGTKGFGFEVARELRTKGYDVITVGRSGGNFNVDIGDEKRWIMVLDEIRKEHAKFDMAIFIAGFARASSTTERTKKEWQEHRQKNVGYVEAALSHLRFAQRATVVTIGSQWSYKKGAKELESYIRSKHQLREFTESFAEEHPEYSVAHIAVPPMSTPQRELVWEGFGDKPEKNQNQVEVADLDVIAEALVEEAVENEHHGELIQIDTHGERHVVVERQRPKENLWPKR